MEAKDSGGKKPSTPTIGTATVGDQSLSVTFTASTYAGKGTITYIATATPGEFYGTGASSPITISKLPNGVAVTVKVKAVTNTGLYSEESAASNSVTPTAPPYFPPFFPPFFPPHFPPFFPPFFPPHFPPHFPPFFK